MGAQSISSPPPALFDTHAHLDAPEYEADLEAVLQRAKSAGVAEIVTVGTDIESTKRAIEIAQAHEGIYASVGFHPHESERFGKDEEETMRRLCSAPKVVAVGEMGLDYYRDHAPREVQRNAFVRQLQIAVDAGLPIILHNRQATEDCLSVLKQFEGRLRGVAHCFSGDETAARRFLKMGFYISLAGPVTFPNAANLGRIAKLLPGDRLLVETDCPWLAPQPVRGKRNEPAFVRYTVQALAGIRGMSTEELGELTTRNARDAFCVAAQ
jgi:TatD DNase family protein